jgi:hypothetical protein
MDKQLKNKINRLANSGMFKDPRNIPGLISRSVDPKTGKIYTGETGLRLQEKKLKEAKWRQANGK